MQKNKTTPKKGMREPFDRGKSSAYGRFSGEGKPPRKASHNKPEQRRKKSTKRTKIISKSINQNNSQKH